MTFLTITGTTLQRLLTASLIIIVTSASSAYAGTTGPGSGQLARAAAALRGNQYQEALQSALTAPADGPRNLLAGVAALRLTNYDAAIGYLVDAERSYPLLSDVATALRADALFAKKQYTEAALAADNAAKRTPTPALKRRMEKLVADAFFEAGDQKAALAAYNQFTTRHTLGKDSIHALYRAGLCQEALGNLAAAVQSYRSIYLQYPASTESSEAFKHLKDLETKGQSAACAFTAEEQLRRGQLLLANNRPNAAASAFAEISRANLSEELLARIDLKSGQAAVKQRHYTVAEPFLGRAAASRSVITRDEARLMLARLEERQGASDKALARLLTLALEKGPLADDALLEAGLIHKNSGRFTEASLLLQRLLHEFPTSDLASRTGWELAWGQYQAGNLIAAEQNLQNLFKDTTYQERALYWYGRTLERQNKSLDADRAYKKLLHDFPFGFYAAWYRGRTSTVTGWPPLAPGLPEPPLPEGSQRIQALASLGIEELARVELASFKIKGPDKTVAPGLARLQYLAGDPHGSIVTFHQNRPLAIDASSLPFWAIGYPRPYGDLFSRYSAANTLSDAMVLALAKAESSFRPTIKSHAGAIGLMQLMPTTARMTAGGKGDEFNQLWLVDPEYNIKIGTKHLRDLLVRYDQDIIYTLAAYNAGAGAVNRWRKSFGELPRDEFIERIPYQETRDYVKKIVASMEMYRSLYRIR
jgi:soluble lytic murein transglycosylase